MNPEHSRRTTSSSRVPPTATHTNNPHSSSSSNANWNESEADPELPRFLLVKNLPQHVSEAEVRGLFSKLPSISEIIILKNSTNVYLRLADLDEANAFVIRKGNLPIHFKGKKLEVCLVSKLPLDLNETSAIVLGTIYKETVEINVKNLHGIFAEFGTLRKMVIFKKKNFQVFVEFASGEEAQYFRGALNNVNYKGLFFLKIQFTRKKELVVSGNNFYEFDFERAQKGELEKVFGQHRPLPDSWKNDQEPPTPAQASKTVAPRPDTTPPQSGSILSEARSEFQVEPCSVPLQLVFHSGDYDRYQAFIDASTIPGHRDISQLGNGSVLHLSDLGGKTYAKPTQLGSTSLIPNQSDTILFPSSSIARPTPSRTYDLLISFFNVSLKSRHLFNLFSLYGDVQSVSVNVYRLAAIVCFTSTHARHKAVSALSPQATLDNQIAIELLDQLPQGFVFEDKQGRKGSPAASRPKDVFVTERFDRFGRGEKSRHKGVAALEPSPFLKICGLSTQFPLQVLVNVFSAVEEVAGVYTNGHPHGWVAFEFESTAAACRVLSHFNSLELLDNVLDISFHSPDDLRQDGERTGENNSTNRISAPKSTKTLTNPPSSTFTPANL